MVFSLGDLDFGCFVNFVLLFVGRVWIWVICCFGWCRLWCCVCIYLVGFCYCVCLTLICWFWSISVCEFVGFCVYCNYVWLLYCGFACLWIG